MAYIVKIRLILLLAAMAFVPAGAYALVPQFVEFHDVSTDTTRIDDMLTAVNAMKLQSPGARVVEFGKLMLGKPYVAGTLEGDDEKLRVNLDELDCTTFVETALAMALTIGERRTSWHDFIYNLERVRYRSGTINGYPSRLHYIADWATDNIYRGNITDVTSRFPRSAYVVKGLDFMSSNADKYPALADSANLAGLRKIEMGYRNHRIPYIKTADLELKGVKSCFANGDIVAFVTKIKNLDVTHVGIVVIKDGEPYLLHASSASGKVEVSSVPLADYVKKNKNLIGVRVFRIAD